MNFIISSLSGAPRNPSTTDLISTKVLRISRISTSPIPETFNSVPLGIPVGGSIDNPSRGVVFSGIFVDPESVSTSVVS
ncbi:MAG: hypothetical protein VCA35_15010, partial [Roseibacillus sp.]